MERGEDLPEFDCVDCGSNTSHLGLAEYYMVRRELWAEAGMEPLGGMLCVGCLEGRIGRQLRPQDFTGAPGQPPPPGQRPAPVQAGPRVLIGKVVESENFRGPRVIVRDPDGHVTYLREGDARWSQRFGDGAGDVSAHDRHAPLVELELDVAAVRGHRREGSFAL